MRPDTEGLRPLLAELRSVVPADDVPAIDELDRRLDEQSLRVVVVGEAKRGKSTLVNALLGREILPTGVVPLTAVTTTVRYGQAEEMTVRFADGTVRDRPLVTLGELVTEQGNPGNARGVTEVVLRLPVPLLAGGVELVDTPGVGSVHAHNTAEAITALDRMDVAVFVVTVDPPISASERAFLQRVRGRAVTLFCVLNKADRLQPTELAEAIDFTRRVVAAELGADALVFPLSARAGLSGSGASAGFVQFNDVFTHYLQATGQQDLIRSIAAHASRLARSVAETQQATIAALNSGDDDFSGRLQRFQLAREAVDRQRIETAALAAAQFDRLRADTDAQATALLADTRPDLLLNVADRVAAATGSAVEMEDGVLTFVTEQIREIVGGWRSRRECELVAAVTELDQRLTARLVDHITAVRDTAARLFSLTMPAVPAPLELATARKVTFAFAPEPEQLELLITAIRHRLPARLARSRIDRYATDRAAELLAKHVGRSRAAFQEQLTETRRQFIRELDRRFAEGAGRIAEAISAAADLRSTQQPRVAAVHAAAESALDTAQLLVERFDAVARSSAASADGHADLAHDGGSRRGAVFP